MNLPQIDDEQTSEQFFVIIMHLQNLWTHMIFFQKTCNYKSHELKCVNDYSKASCNSKIHEDVNDFFLKKSAIANIIWTK
jgi:hypothetical protein